MEKVKDKQKAFLQACMARLDRRLRPFDQIPSEVLTLIFEQVHADWEQLPSPFQIAHVCRRWRDLAFATPSLWRDTRILRVATKVAKVDFGLSSAIRKPPCLPPSTAFLISHAYAHPRGDHHYKLLDFCATKSRHTLTHFEIETASHDHGFIPFSDAAESAATLESLSVVNKARDCSMFMATFDLICRCPKLATLELSLGDLDEHDLLKLRDFQKEGLTTMPSFRTLKLHNFDIMAYTPNIQLQQLFLQRCTQVESLILLDDETRSSPLGQSDFIQELLTACADTLVNLETSGRAGLFKGFAQAGLRGSFPKLRRFRHVDFCHPHEDDGDVDVCYANAPQLEMVEATCGIASSFPNVPSRYVLQVYNLDDYDEIAEWLGELHDDASPREITIEALTPTTGDAMQAIIDILTPSIAGRVVCPKLTSFAFLRKDEIYSKGTDSSPFAFESVPVKAPTFAQQWETMADVSRIATMETQRRRVSEGLPPVAVKTKRKSSVSPPRSSRSRRQAVIDDDGEHERDDQEAQDPKVWPRCEPLRAITIEGCHIQDDVWAVMKSSPSCQYMVSPNPDEMKGLPDAPPDGEYRSQSFYL